VREDAEEHFGAHTARGPRSERGSETSFEATEGALHLPALPIASPREATKELAAIGGGARGPCPRAPRAQVDRNNHRVHGEPLVTPAMVDFGIVPAVAEEPAHEPRR